VRTEVEVLADESVTVGDLNLTPVGNIAGRATLAGAATGNLGIMVFIAGTSFSAMTDDAGSYTISEVPAGTGYVLVATSVITGGYDACTSSASVSAFTTSSGGDLALQAHVAVQTTGSISGHVTLAGTGAGASGVFVFLQGTSCIAVTDDAGAYVLKDVAPGTYSLAACKEGYTSPSAVSLTVTAGSVADGGTIDLEPTTAPVYVVSYDGNGATSGSVPADTNRYLTGSTVFVQGNTGGLAWADHIFLGWNTKADGTGTDYRPGATFVTGTASTTLYARWTIGYSVTYDGNGATSGSVPDAGTLHAPGSSVSVLGNSGFLARNGYAFAGWLATVNGVTAAYQAASSFTMGSVPMVLKAIWIPSTLTFSCSGATITITGYSTAPTGSLVIPAGVTALGNGALQNCTSLTSVTLPSGLLSIGDSAFAFCSSLTSVALPDSVSSIGYGAFNQTAVSTLCIPAGLASLNAFMLGASRVASFTVSPSNPTYMAVDGIVYNKAGTILVMAPPMASGTFTVPAGVKEIAQLAFSYSRYSAVNLPDGLTTIRNAAFSNASLASITVPASVTTMESSIWMYCASLTTATFASGVTAVPGQAFFRCTALTTCTLPATISSIGGSAFYYCSSLANVYCAPVSPPVLADDRSFTSCPSTMKIHVPTTSLAAYKAAAYWSVNAANIVSP
jgi:hypothetical protein